MCACVIVCLRALCTCTNSVCVVHSGAVRVWCTVCACGVFDAVRACVVQCGSACVLCGALCRSVRVCCSVCVCVLQCSAVCVCVVYCAAVCAYVLQCGAVCVRVVLELLCGAVWCSVCMCDAVWRSVCVCGAQWCSVCVGVAVSGACGIVCGCVV